jgi:hypothetical protein
MSPVISTQFSIRFAKLRWYLGLQSSDDLADNDVVENGTVADHKQRDLGQAYRSMLGWISQAGVARTSQEDRRPFKTSEFKIDTFRAGVNIVASHLVWRAHHRIACLFFKAREGYALSFFYLHVVRRPPIFFAEFIAKALDDFCIVFPNFL